MFGASVVVQVCAEAKLAMKNPLKAASNKIFGAFIRNSEFSTLSHNSNALPDEFRLAESKLEALCFK
jgi:hypothetical protein